MRTVRSLVVMLGLVTPLAAQQQATAQWAEAKCDLKPGHYLVNSGILYLKSASTTRFADQRQKDLKDAQRTLNQALTTGNQDKNPAAWYYLGRYYILTDDARGADSAFNKAEAIKPDCKTDIDIWRRAMWRPAFNAGYAAYQANNNDSAIVYFRKAISLMPSDPAGYTFLATVLYNSGQADSGVYYFRRAADVAAKDPKAVPERKEALYNLARIQQGRQQWDSAAVAWREYLALTPSSAEALTALGTIQMQKGNKDSAFAIYKQIVGKADSMGYLTLFQVGMQISTGVPDEPDTAAAGSSCRATARQARPPLTLARIRARCDSVTTGIANTYRADSKEAFQIAAQALDASLKLNPYYRDALIHRANTALGLHDSVTALEMSRRLIQIDPMNRVSMRIMAYSQQQMGKVDSTIHYLRLADSTLIADVTVSQFDSTDKGRDLKGIITNTRKTANQPFNLVWEFVDAKGQVLATDTVKVGVIQPEQSQAFESKPNGAGIVAWRYRKQ